MRGSLSEGSLAGYARSLPFLSVRNLKRVLIENETKWLLFFSYYDNPALARTPLINRPVRTLSLP